MSPGRRASALFVGSLFIAVLLAACGEGARDSDGKDSRRTIGIPALAGIHSGELEATLSLDGPSGQVDMRLLGTFLDANGKGMPQVDFAAEANGQMNGEPVEVFTALIATHDRAVLTYGGDTFETSRPMFEALRAGIERPLGSGSGGDPAACLEAVGRIVPGRILGKVTPPASATMYDGTAVSATEADLRAPALAQALRQLLDDPACGAQVQATGSLRRVLEGVERKLQNGVKESSGMLALDKNAHLGELLIHLAFGSPGPEETEVELKITLTQVNEIADLPPCHGERKLAALFAELGFNPLAAMERGGAGGLVGLIRAIYDGVEGSRAV
jgi:hypothetical protein